MAAIHWCCHSGGGRKTSARQRSLSLSPVKLCSVLEGKRGSNYKWNLTLQYLLIQRNEAVLTLKKLRLPSKYMVEGMGNVHPNILEDLKEEINCKSCTAPLATFFSRRQPEMYELQKILDEVNMKTSTIKWFKVSFK